MKRVINGKTYSKTIGVKKGELAAFGDNGELNASGVKAEDIPSFPEGGNVGDVLTKTADGQEWNTPSSGTPTYVMEISINSEYATPFRIRGTAIAKSDTPFTVGSISYADFKSKILKVASTPDYLVVSNFFGITVNTTGDNAPFEVCSYIRLKNDNEVVFQTSSAELTYNLTNSSIRIDAVYEV